MSRHKRGHHQPHHASNDEMIGERGETSTVNTRNVGGKDRPRLIEVRAYGLWEKAGKPDGDAAREQF